MYSLSKSAGSDDENSADVDDVTTFPCEEVEREEDMLPKQRGATAAVVGREVKASAVAVIMTANNTATSTFMIDLRG